MADTTTSPAHTPGPWHIDLQSPHCPIVIKPHLGRIICDICGIYAEAHANARLIAAAPELLAALKNLCQIERDLDPESRNLDERRLGEYEALIAQAEGEPGIGDPCPCCGDFIEAGHSCN